MSGASNEKGLLLSGLDGANPLAFLAALGTLRTLTLVWPQREVTMQWRQSDGAWRPLIGVAKDSGPLDQNEVLDALESVLPTGAEIPAFHIGDDLTVSVEDFRRAAMAAVGHAHGTGDRRGAHFLSAFGSDAVTETSNNESMIKDTALRTMSGAGHQHFLQFMRNLIDRTRREHLHKALFHEWRYDDPVANMTLRWDPIDDDPYALRWRNPSGDPARRSGGSMWGAYRLAIEALPLMPAVPTLRNVSTVGFVEHGRSGTYWTWPIWECPTSLDVCASLLVNPVIAELGNSDGDMAERTKLRAALLAMGVTTLFSSRRITIGKYRCFTPARAV